MCEKTKTVFGCGHAVKTLDDCGRHCSKPNRWCFEKSADCSTCKAGGSSVSRGADGRGRYGRHLTQAREKPSSRSVPLDTPLAIEEQALDPPPSPWVDVERTGHKSWDSPTRKRADDAWLVEHEDRMSDLQEKMYNISCSPRRASPPPSKDSYERIIQLTDAEDDDIELVRSTRDAEPVKVKKYVYELSDDSDRYASKASRRSERSGRRRRVDSEDSMPYYVETPRSKVIYTRRPDPLTAYDYDGHDTYDTNRRSSRRHGSKTETSYARSVIYDSTVSGSPQSAGHFTNYERIHIPRSDARYQRKCTRERY